MTDKPAPKIDWTQDQIVEETRRIHGSEPGFFDTLHTVCWEAFGHRISEDDLGYPDKPPEGKSWEDLPLPGWRFLMGNLTVGQVLDFFDAHQAGDPIINWHNQSGGPDAEIVIEDYNLAEAFRDQFRIRWDSPGEARARQQEDYLRAAGYR